MSWLPYSQREEWKDLAPIPQVSACSFVAWLYMHCDSCMCIVSEVFVRERECVHVHVCVYMCMCMLIYICI